MALKLGCDILILPHIQCVLYEVRFPIHYYHEYVLVRITICKFLEALDDCIVKKTLDEICRKNYLSLHAFSRIVDLMSPKLRKRDPKV